MQQFAQQSLKNPIKQLHWQFLLECLMKNGVATARKILVKDDKLCNKIYFEIKKTLEDIAHQRIGIIAGTDTFKYQKQFAQEIINSIQTYNNVVKEIKVRKKKRIQDAEYEYQNCKDYSLNDFFNSQRKLFKQSSLQQKYQKNQS